MRRPNKLPILHGTILSIGLRAALHPVPAVVQGSFPPNYPFIQLPVDQALNLTLILRLGKAWEVIMGRALGLAAITLCTLSVSALGQSSTSTLSPQDSVAGHGTEYRTLIDTSAVLSYAKENPTEYAEIYRRIREARNPITRALPQVLAEIQQNNFEMTARRSEIAALDFQIESAQRASQQPIYMTVEERLKVTTEQLARLKNVDEGRRTPKQKQEIEEKIWEVDLNMQRQREYEAHVKTAAEKSSERKAKLDSINQYLVKAGELSKTYSGILGAVQSLDDLAISVVSADRNDSRNTLFTTMVFAGLVAIVIVSFFVIAFRSEDIRKAVFGSDAGLQFVTIFSLVIAIILFGVLKILEGRELAALLGGLSGYILGRGSISSTGAARRTDGPPPAQTT